jgi:flagellar biosynthesis protein FlhF
MIQETFVAATPKEAYENAVAKYGTSDLDIVSAKQIFIDNQQHSELVIEVPKDIFMAYSFISKDDNVITQEEQLQAEIDELKEEILKFTQEIKQPKDITPTHKVKQSIKDEVRELFVSKGLASQWLDSILDEISQSAIIDNKELFVSYIFEEIDASLKVFSADMEKSKVVMLVGPTGVGKTTTLAKLAARYAYLLDRPYKVALINLDSFKVGAIEQLGHYAEIMQIEHFVVDDVDAFKEGVILDDGYKTLPAHLEILKSGSISE